MGINTEDMNRISIDKNILIYFSHLLIKIS